MRHPPPTPPPPMQHDHRQRHPHDYYPAAAAAYHHYPPPPPPMPPAGGDRSLYSAGVPSRGDGGSSYFSRNLPGTSRDDHRRWVPHTQLARTPPAAVLVSSSHASKPAREKDGQGPVEAPAPAVGNTVKLQLIPLKPVIRCGLCKLNFTSSESLERHKTKRQHKKSLLMQKFQNTPENKSSNVGEANKAPTASENKQQTPFLTTEQTMEGGQPDPEEAKRERRRLKRQAAKWRNKDMKTMRYYKLPSEPPKEQPRCCILCNVTYQTKDTFESHLSGKKHVSQLSLCEDEDSVYGLINAYIPPDRLTASQEQVPMFYGLKTRKMLQQEARGQAIVLDYEWRTKGQVLTVNGGALDVNMDSEEQSGAVECGTKEEMASTTSHKALPGHGADRGALEKVNIDLQDQNAVEFPEKEQTGFASEVAMSHQASLAVPEYNVVLLGLGADNEEQS